MTDVLGEVNGLAPLIAEQADQGERDRRVRSEVITALTSAGCLRMAVPADRGGKEMSLPDVLEVAETVARCDASAGWLVGVSATAHLIFAHLDRPALDQIYGGGPDVFGAGAIAPKGTAERVEGGWRISGRWPFVSGCENASWIYLQCVERSEGAASLGSQPRIRTAVFPSDKVSIVDTWDVVGLRGTGSHDVAVEDAFCPDELTCSIFTEPPHLTGPLYAIPLLDQLGTFLAAAALGNARGAVDEVAGVAAAGKRPAFNPRRLAKSASFRERLGEAYMTLTGARSHLFTEAEGAWRTACAGEEWDVVARARLRAGSATCIQTCAKVVDTAYALGGGTSVFDRSPLQRRLRDAHTMTQHAVAGRTPYEIVGAVLAGEDVSSMLF